MDEYDANFGGTRGRWHHLSVFEALLANISVGGGTLRCLNVRYCVMVEPTRRKNDSVGCTGDAACVDEWYSTGC